MSGDITLEAAMHFLTEGFGLRREDISAESKLFEDLGFDSLASVELAAKLEILADRQLADEAVLALETVRDLGHFIETLAGDGPPART